LVGVVVVLLSGSCGWWLLCLVVAVAMAIGDGILWLVVGFVRFL